MSLGALSACHFAPGRKNEDFNSLWNQMRCRNITNNKDNLITPPLRRLYPTTTTLSVFKRTPAGISGKTHMSCFLSKLIWIHECGLAWHNDPFSIDLLQISPNRTRRDAYSFSFDLWSHWNWSTLLPGNNKEAKAGDSIQTRMQER